MATRSRRSVGDRPAAGSSNRMKRGAPDSASAISSWRCWPWLSIGDRRLQDVVEMDGVSDRSRLRHRRVLLRRPQQREAMARNAAAGDENAVDDRQAAEQLADLIGPAQAAPDPFLDRESR